MQKPIIHTCAHSNKPISAFIKLLKDNDIELLVDVRSIPSSRFCPQFNKSALYATLSLHSIKYLWKGKNLGGKDINVNYEEAINALVTLAKQGVRIAVMCSEKDYRKCHRYTVLTPSFEAEKVSVIHLEYENEKKVS